MKSFSSLLSRQALIRSGICVCSLVTALNFAHSSVIEWDFEGAAVTTNQNTMSNGIPQSGLGATSVDFATYGGSNTFSGVTVGNFVLSANDRGTDITSTNHLNAPTNVDYGSNFATTGADAVAGQNVASFTITIDDTVIVDLTSLTFDWGFTDFSGAANGLTPTYTLAVDGGGIFSTDGTGALPTISASENDDFFQVDSYDATIGGLTGLTDTTLTFTWQFESNEDRGNGNRRHLLDNIALNGTFTAVPEPGSYALLAGMLALVSVALRRRA